MAAALDRRGPDDRRPPVLAAPEAGRERGGAAIPAHRAGGRDQVRGPGLRSALARVNVAVTSMVVLAFLIPLGAGGGASWPASARWPTPSARPPWSSAVLAVTTDPVAVERAIAAPAASRPTGSACTASAPAPVGDGHATASDLATPPTAAPAIGRVAGGLVLPRAGRRSAPGRTAVVEVFVPDAELTRGVAGAWWALIGVALVLLVASVLVSDRLAARVVRSARGLAAAARALGDGDLDVRVHPAGPRELAEAGVAFNAMADRVVDLRPAERELIADLSHRLRTPLTALRLEAETRVRDSRRRAHPRRERRRRGDGAARSTTRSDRPPAPPERRRPEPAPAVCDAAEVVRERMVFWSARRRRPEPAVPGRSGATAALPVPRAPQRARRRAGRLARQRLPLHPAGHRVRGRGQPRGTATWWCGWTTPAPASATRTGRCGAATSDRGSTGLGLDIVRRAALAGQRHGQHRPGQPRRRQRGDAAGRRRRGAAGRPQPVRPGRPALPRARTNAAPAAANPRRRQRRPRSRPPSGADHAQTATRQGGSVGAPQVSVMSPLIGSFGLERHVDGSLWSARSHVDGPALTRLATLEGRPSRARRGRVPLPCARSRRAPPSLRRNRACLESCTALP